jgi:hypothetical protein
MSLNLPVPTFTTGDVITATSFNANNAAIIAKFAGGISNADLSVAAGISPSKLSASYEHMDVNLCVTTSQLAAGWPGGTVIVAGAPVPGVAGETSWEATSVTWSCTDTGGGTGTFDVVWGYFFAGAFVPIINNKAAAGTI